MKHKIDTKFGEVEISNAIFDTDGTNLESGVEIRVDGNLVLEIFNHSVSYFEELTKEEIENFLKIQCNW